jgi:rRNA processing protein Gar1
MSLIKCSECGNEVSSDAEKCPKCGMPTKTKKPQKVGFVFKILGGLIFAFFAIGIVGTIIDKSKGTSQQSDVSFAGGIIQQKLVSPGSYHLVSGETVWKGESSRKDAIGLQARVVKVEFDSQNTFGALLRGCYYVAFEYDKDEKHSSFSPSKALLECKTMPDEAKSIDWQVKLNFHD